MHTTMKDARRCKDIGSDDYLAEKKQDKIEADKKIETDKKKAAPKAKPAQAAK